MALPILDLSPFLGPSSVPARRAAAAALDDACRTHGFFYLTAHGIPPELEQRVLAQARKFFCPSTSSSNSSPQQQQQQQEQGQKQQQQQQQRKQRLARRDPGLGGDGARGYQRLGENVTQGASDHHEAIDFYRPVSPPVLLDPADAAKGWKLLHGPNLWPIAADGTTTDTEFRSAFEEFWARLLELGHAVMVAMAWALGYQDPADEDALLRHTRNGFWVARAIGYPPLAAVPEGDGDGGLSCGAHTDYGCTTFLLADDTPGALQVLSKAGQWINADPVPGCYVVNIGDMMEVWTNGLWASTQHRVVHHAPAGRGYRVSVPFFYEPDWDAVVRPLDKCVQRSGGVPRYAPKVYGEHLVEKVRGNFYAASEPLKS